MQEKKQKKIKASTEAEEIGRVSVKLGWRP